MVTLIMAGMRIERYSASRRRGGMNGCGCAIISGILLITVGGLLLASGLLLPLIFALTGTERIGNTDSMFDQNTPLPTVAVAGSSPRSVRINLGSYGVETLSGSDINADGSRASARFTEDTLLDLCAERTPICRGGNSQLRNVAIDLRNGGAVIYADAFTGVNWQRVGIVLQVDAGTQFNVVGVDISGVTYNSNTLPFGLSDTVGDLVQDIEREGNALLRQLTVNAESDVYRLGSISVDETTLTINLRSAP